jgi:hypothetical protein
MEPILLAKLCASFARSSSPIIFAPLISKSFNVSAPNSSPPCGCGSFPPPFSLRSKRLPNSGKRVLLKEASADLNSNVQSCWKGWHCLKRSVACWYWRGRRPLGRTCLGVLAQVLALLLGSRGMLLRSSLRCCSLEVRLRRKFESVTCPESQQKNLKYRTI